MVGAVRLPISYLLKLALADLLGAGGGLPEPLLRRGERLLDHFTNDNSSPETVSLYVCHVRNPGRLGRELATETALRFLLNRSFKLRENGQAVHVFFALLPGGRLKELNRLILDSPFNLRCRGFGALNSSSFFNWHRTGS